ncbi:hypothetical protein [Aliiroseovarius crassostreae]|uniref:hypothetical protein n=1 Tax=Aliiroseovarius crassostreae TaxID=154981 RepID=UPI0022030726|nr:hypothetical protein [Aliiroseovarius crassostreae]UWQ04869.1 hypothetical protein K3X22_14790 [Aliiroseovarius crassostreae]
MSLANDLALTAHILGLFMGGASAFGLPVIGALADKAELEHKPVLGRAVKPLKMIGHIGLGLILITGVLMATAGGIWSSGPFIFWIKLVAVGALIAGIVVAGKTGALAMAGDAEAAAKMPMLSMFNIGMGVLVVLFAVLAFN